MNHDEAPTCHTCPHIAHITGAKKEEYDPGSAKWHLDKRLNVGHLITTMALAASVFAWGGAIDRRIALVEAAVNQNEKDNHRQDQTLKDNAQLIRDDLRSLKEELREIARKLDTKSAPTK